MLDELALRGLNRATSPSDSPRAAFLEVFSKAEARRRLLGGPEHALTPTATALAASFEVPIRA
jgi:hypothetical protein